MFNFISEYCPTSVIFLIDFGFLPLACLYHATSIYKFLFFLQILLHAPVPCTLKDVKWPRRLRGAREGEVYPPGKLLCVALPLIDTFLHVSHFAAGAWLYIQPASMLVFQYLAGD